MISMDKTRVFVKSFGCSANLADGEVLSGCLKQAGYKLAEKESKADVIVLNTCAVKGPTEDRMIHKIRKVSRKRKLIVTGCLPLINVSRLRNETTFDALAPPQAAEHIVEIVARVLQGERFDESLAKQPVKLPDLCLPRVRSNPIISLIPVCYGCLGLCSYCCVKNARGNLRSYSISEITKRIKQDLSSGAREFWITGQDTACYGRDIGTDLARLLKAVTNIEGRFKVRVGMMTPDNSMPILGELTDVFMDDRIFKFLHVPVQSGDDDILKRMNRHYSAKDFKILTSAFRDRYPTITLSTDVICGFPGENNEAFEETVRLLKQTEPDIVNISKFFARPNTLARNMKNISVQYDEIKRRSRTLAILCRSIALKKNRYWVGWKGQVLVDERGKVEDTWIARNYAYKPIVLKNQKSDIGRLANVRVTKSFQTYLEALEIG